MASDGLTSTARNGTCRMCYRSRNVNKYLKVVGEVRHGFATGHIWECKDIKECDDAISRKFQDPERQDLWKIELSVKQGRFKEYQYFS